MKGRAHWCSRVETFVHLNQALVSDYYPAFRMRHAPRHDNRFHRVSLAEPALEPKKLPGPNRMIVAHLSARHKALLGSAHSPRVPNDRTSALLATTIGTRLRVITFVGLSTVAQPGTPSWPSYLSEATPDKIRDQLVTLFRQLGSETPNSQIGSIQLRASNPANVLMTLKLSAEGKS